jgi:putative serine/threonine protein kinase
LPNYDRIPVTAFVGTGYSRILTYPGASAEEVKARIQELAEIGVTELCFEGSTLIDGISILGKGCVGLVTKATLDGAPIALKIRRTDADRSSMGNEGRLLRMANSVDVGPRLMAATKNFLAMELIEGVPLFRWAESSFALKKMRAKHVLRRLLVDCFRLDTVGLDHGELSHAPKNVLVSRTGEPFIVDFETASTARRVANVTSLLQYFLFGRISGRIRVSIKLPRKNVVLKALVDYKREGSVETFQNILSVLELEQPQL